MTKKKVEVEEKQELTAEETKKHKSTSNNTEEVRTENQTDDKKSEVEADKEKTSEVSAEEKVKEFQEKYLRLSAEFDNYRKRTLKERIELTKVASEEILVKLLPVFDDFERALQHMDDAKDVDAVKEGVGLIYNKFSDLLKQQGVKEIEAKNQEFDMDLHEAVTKIPAPDDDLKGKVVDVIEKGYYLHEKIIRYPKVVVGE